MTTKPYYLEYTTKKHPEGLSAEEAQRIADENGSGFCTAALVCSILYPPDGSYSVLFRPIDGRSEECLSDDEMWKVWMLLTSRLAQSHTLNESKKEFCKVTFDGISEVFFGRNVRIPEGLRRSQN